MNDLRLLLPLLVLSAACPALAQGVAKNTTIWTAPDGSRFVLAPSRGPGVQPVIHWVVAIPTPLDDDPGGAIGLSRAVIRASLDGTRTHGALDVVAEAAALAELDRVRAEVWRAVGTDGRSPLPADLETRFKQARERVADLAEPAAWQRAVARSPATEVELFEPSGGSLLHVATSPTALPRVAVLLKEWREEAVLRRIHDEQVRIRGELEALVETTSGRMRKEVLGTTYLGAAAARYVEGRGTFVPLADAERHRQKLVHPTRTLHVLTGGFDQQQVEALLRAVFDRTALPTSPAPTVLAPADARARRSVVPSAATDAVAFAWPIPAGTTGLELQALGDYLAGSERAFLPRTLRRDGPVGVSFIAPFPANATDPMFVLEVTGGPGGQPSAALERSTLERLAELAKTANAREIEGSANRARATLATRTASAEALAIELATTCGLLGGQPGAVLDPGSPPGSRRLLQVAEEMFGAGPRTVVAVTGSR